MKILIAVVGNEDKLLIDYMVNIMDKIQNLSWFRYCNHE